MINEKHIDLVIAYIDDSITTEQRARLNNLIDQGKIDILEIKQMEATYQKMDKLPASEPTEKMHNTFYTMLEEEKKQQAPQRLTILLNRLKALFRPIGIRRIAVASVIFLVGIFAGNLLTPFQDYRQQMNQLSEEVSKMRQVMMMSLLDNQSSSERLKAVNISTNIQSADSRMISALLKTLNNDPNVNVRLATVEALVRHASNPDVRQGLVQSISKQQSPQVQVALADAMLAMQEPRSVDELQKLLQQNGLNGAVRDKLENTIAALDKNPQSL
ncbi:HEAT repeat domain-containing protein [Fodinibius saliphilus]|uniref:HEAT repeat domain-containing protein n=1 Tax=Fodinibius saliphilus TaxID=1920650 RepID=UPI001107DEAC|nr:HEAT repeat domain-containing protein [Fodinibius saliphilus]